MPWRVLLSVPWIRGVTLSAAALLLLTALTSGYTQTRCTVAKACEEKCCPCAASLCVADTVSQQIVIAPALTPKFQSLPLSLLAALPWHAPVASVGFPGPRAIRLGADPGRLPRGPSRPQLSVWLI